jgi:hypothetical protein
MFSAGSPYLLPVDQRLEAPYSPDWTSEPLDEPLEILGHPRAVLHVAVTTDVATVVARLVDVAPDGTAALVTKGVLNLTHRESHAQPTPVVPGQVYEIALELDATSWHFEAGHRIRLAISGADFPNTWPSPKPYSTELHVGGGRGANTGSRLILPVANPQASLLSAPALCPPTSFEPTAETQSECPTWRVTRDHLAATTEVFLRTAGRTRVSDELSFNSSHEATASVFEQNPARATIRGFSRVELYWPQRVIDACARGQIESTEDAFHVTINLEIKLDGLPHASKRWVRTFPRQLL